MITLILLGFLLPAMGTLFTVAFVIMGLCLGLWLSLHWRVTLAVLAAIGVCEYLMLHSGGIL